jgi:RNA polymerase sigma factor (sigma-70 family)
MGIDSNRSRLFPLAARIIRRKARSLVGMYGFRPSDAEDLEQTLTLEVLRRAPGFDPRKGSEGQFLSTVVARAIASLVERHNAAKRGFGFAIVSLDAGIEYTSGDNASSHDVIDKESYLQTTRSGETPEVQCRDLLIDFERACRSLPEDLWQLACQLSEQTPSEIARSTGIPRTTINDRIKKLRARLRKSGLGDYLNFPPSDRRRFR